MNRDDYDPARVTVQRRIEWIDTDMAGRWHFTAAFRLVEAAETALWEHLGGKEQVIGDLPRVHVEANFRHPLHYRDLVEVELRIDRVGDGSLTYGFELRRDGAVCAEGKFVVVALAADGSVRSIPEQVRQALLTAGVQPPDFVPYPSDPSRSS